MSAVSFRNTGLIDLRSVRTFGVSAKENENPIGFFGTGLKYAIAICLRLGCQVTMWRGLERFDFATSEVAIRNGEFRIVTMNGEEIGFTTDLGKTWEPWQAYREIHCNTTDERGDILDGEVEPREGYTTFVIKGACPKRTGNQPDLFGDVKSADVCTDPACFKQKIAAHAERVIAAAADTDQKILTGAEAKKAAKYGTDAHQLEGYVRLDAKDYHGGSGKPRTFRQVLGKDYVPTLLQDPDTGKMIEIAANKDVDKAHGDGHLTSNDRHAKQYAEKQRAAERKHRQQIAYRSALFKAIHDAGVGRNKPLNRSELERAGERLFERLDNDSKKRLFAALGWETKKARYGGTDFPFPIPIENMSEGQLAQLIRDCAIAHELQVWQHSGETRPKDMEAAAAELGVDCKKLGRELEAAAKAKADKQKSAPAKASKKAKGKK